MASFTRMILPATRAMLIPNSGVSYVRPVSSAIINAYNQQSLVTSQPSFQTQTNSILLNSYRSFQTTAVSRDIDTADKFIETGACTVGTDGSDNLEELIKLKSKIEQLKEDKDKLGKQLLESKEEIGELKSKLKQRDDILLQLKVRSRIEELEMNFYRKIPAKAHSRREKWKLILTDTSSEFINNTDLMSFRKMVSHINPDRFIYVICHVYAKCSNAAAHRMLFPIQWDPKSISKMITDLGMTPDINKVNTISAILTPIP